MPRLVQNLLGAVRFCTEGEALGALSAADVSPWTAFHNRRVRHSVPLAMRTLGFRDNLLGSCVRSGQTARVRKGPTCLTNS